MYLSNNGALCLLCVYLNIGEPFHIPDVSSDMTADHRLSSAVRQLEGFLEGQTSIQSGSIRLDDETASS